MTSSDLPRRRSLRLHDYDYAQAGAYFITICTHDRICLLGQIMDGTIRLSALGRIVEACWNDLPFHHPRLALDAVAIMPNHIHAVILFEDLSEQMQSDSDAGAGAAGSAPTVGNDEPRKRTKGTVVRSFKAAAIKSVREHVNSDRLHLWQREYYEHIIRSEAALARVREYIELNPAKWALDSDNPAN